MKKLVFVLPVLMLATVLLAGCSKNSDYITCTEEQKNAEICTMEYMPVCGDDEVTYGNVCAACISETVDSYKMGECEATCGEGDEGCEVELQ